MKPWQPGEPVRVMDDLREDQQPASEGGGPEAATKPSMKPIVRGPVKPRVQDKDLSELPKMKPYKKGDPVRVMEDLKESDSDQ
jgi:hypothetical protein